MRKWLLAFHIAFPILKVTNRPLSGRLCESIVIRRLVVSSEIESEIPSHPLHCTKNVLENEVQ